MIIPGIYEHFKGHQYEVLGMGLMEESEKPVVIYKALYENELSSLWVRSPESFEAMVEWEGKTVPRFRYVSESKG